MMYLDFEGKTEKEAIKLALDSLGLEEGDIQVKSLSKGQKGFLGIGKKVNAKIRVYYKEKNEIIEIVDKVKRIIEKIDSHVYFDFKFLEDDRYILNIDSANPGQLIGRSGKTIIALQSIVNAILKGYQKKYKLLIDVNGYKGKQQRKLIDEAMDEAKKVMETGESISLGEKNPYMRREIHMAISKLEGVSTESKGEGRYKEISIVPKK